MCPCLLSSKLCASETASTPFSTVASVAAKMTVRVGLAEEVKWGGWVKGGRKGKGGDGQHTCRVALQVTRLKYFVT